MSYNAYEVLKQKRLRSQFQPYLLEMSYNAYEVLKPCIVTNTTTPTAFLK